MRIDGVSQAASTILAAMAREGTRFAAAPALPVVELAPPPPTPSLAAAHSVQMLVALSAASAENAQERRRREARPISDVLDLLEGLHRSSAMGVGAAEAIQRLEAWTGQFQEPSDPGLAEIARELELRVKVELAKHERIV